MKQLPMDPGLAEFKGCSTSSSQKTETQRTGRPQGPSEATSRMCPFQTSGVGLILWVQGTTGGTEIKGHTLQQVSQSSPKRRLFPHLSKKNKTQDTWVLSSTYHHVQVRHRFCPLKKVNCHLVYTSDISAKPQMRPLAAGTAAEVHNVRTVRLERALQQNAEPA